MTGTDFYSSLSSDTLVKQVVAVLEESKAEDIVTIDLAQKSVLADYLVIASGRSQRHLRSVSEKLKHYLHMQGVQSVRIEGLIFCDWVLIDAGDIIIHLFRPELREFYNLEKMWSATFSPHTQPMIMQPS
jgi:ribosome-associated protein